MVKLAHQKPPAVGRQTVFRVASQAGEQGQGIAAADFQIDHESAAPALAHPGQQELIAYVPWVLDQVTKQPVEAFSGHGMETKCVFAMVNDARVIRRRPLEWSIVDGFYLGTALGGREAPSPGRRTQIGNLISRSGRFPEQGQGFFQFQVGTRRCPGIPPHPSLTPGPQTCTGQAAIMSREKDAQAGMHGLAHGRGYAGQSSNPRHAGP